MVYGMQVDGYFGAWYSRGEDVGARIKVFKKYFKKQKKSSQKNCVGTKKIIK